MTGRVAGASQRAQIWVPGLVVVDDERRLLCGGQVGYDGPGEAFRVAGFPREASLRDWRHRGWFVVRAELTAALIERHALVLPETLLDPDIQPYARRWLSEQPLLCVSGSKVQRLVDDGVRIYSVEMGVVKAGFLRASAEGGKGVVWQLEGALDELLAASEGPQTALLPSEQPSCRTFLERLLSVLSTGQLGERALVNALAIRCLVEPGYGYHGARDGVAAPIGQVQRCLRGIDALFAQIYPRAEDMHEQAEAIAKTLSGAPADVEDVILPLYGTARCDLLPERRVSFEGGQSALTVAAEPRDHLLLPRLPRWTVERVSLWQPSLPESVREALERELPAPWYLASWLLPVLVGGLVLLIVAGALFGDL